MLRAGREHGAARGHHGDGEPGGHPAEAPPPQARPPRRGAEAGRLRGAHDDEPSAEAVLRARVASRSFGNAARAIPHVPQNAW